MSSIRGCILNIKTNIKQAFCMITKRHKGYKYLKVEGKTLQNDKYGFDILWCPKCNKVWICKQWSIISEKDLKK